MLLAAVDPAQLLDACGDDPSWLCRTTLDATGDETATRVVDVVLGTPLAIALIVGIALLANRFARRALRRAVESLDRDRPAERPDGELTAVRRAQRMHALTSVLSSIVSFVIVVLATLMILGELGIELGPLLAGAGIVGVALGFGSQALVRDFLSGVFILAEDQFGVGDIVDLDKTTTGTVEAVSLRTTRLRSVDGTVWHVPNGDIRRVGNMSQLWSRALLDIPIAADADVERAKQVLLDTARELQATDEAILEDPEVWGVEDFGAGAVTLRLVVKTTPSEQWRVSRLLRERLKAALDAAGISMPAA
ncbi:MAG TPA: mechanosensitive ion channel family protein [Capillimicrobium sp.]|jgi:small conductance mechanosensitive channel